VASVPGPSDETFEAFVDAHAAALGRLAHQLTGDHDRALDLAQDTLVRALDGWDRVEAAEHRFAYVRRMMVNLHLNSRRIRVPVPTDPAVADARSDAVDQASDQVEQDAMWRALGELPVRQRTVLVLRYYEGVPDTEIAAIIGCRRATVRSLAARGLAALRRSSQLVTASDSESGRVP
jgi:RNA polymerase sigma-70 factor (sigma-E family)